MGESALIKDVVESKTNHYLGKGYKLIDDGKMDGYILLGKGDYLIEIGIATGEVTGYEGKMTMFHTFPVFFERKVTNDGVESANDKVDQESNDVLATGSEHVLPPQT